MTKQEAMPEVDWEAMKYASRLRLTMKTGETYIARSFTYWPTASPYADLLVGPIYLEQEDGELGPPQMQELPLPNPDVVAIEIINSFDHENHPSHPEHAYVFPTVGELYESE